MSDSVAPLTAAELASIIQIFALGGDTLTEFECHKVIDALLATIDADRPRTPRQEPKGLSFPSYRRMESLDMRGSTRKRIRKRDGDNCHLCGLPIWFEAPRTPHSKNSPHSEARAAAAPTVDHVIPRSYGGPNDLENLRLAHRWCNRVRATSLPEVFRLRYAGVPRVSRMLRKAGLLT